MCDSHIHILDPHKSFINGKNFSKSATWEQYRSESVPVGLQRAVIIQPSFYGFDNKTLLNTLKQNQNDTRGIVVIPKDIRNKQLDILHTLGVRGIRFNTVSGGLDLLELEYFARLIKPLGWHIQIYLDSAELPHLMPKLINLQIDIVLDHMAHVNRKYDLSDSGFNCLLRGMDTGRVWVKLSNALFPPDIERGKRLVAQRSDRVVWASDWPHVIFKGQPDPLSKLIKSCNMYSSKKDIIKQILVDNPDKLYFW